MLTYKREVPNLHKHTHLIYSRESPLELAAKASDIRITNIEWYDVSHIEIHESDPQATIKPSYLEI